MDDVISVLRMCLQSRAAPGLVPAILQASTRTRQRRARRWFRNFSEIRDADGTRAFINRSIHYERCLLKARLLQRDLAHQRARGAFGFADHAQVLRIEFDTGEAVR